MPVKLKDLPLLYPSIEKYPDWLEDYETAIRSDPKRHHLSNYIFGSDEAQQKVIQDLRLDLDDVNHLTDRVINQRERFDEQQGSLFHGTLSCMRDGLKEAVMKHESFGQIQEENDVADLLEIIRECIFVRVQPTTVAHFLGKLNDLRMNEGESIYSLEMRIRKLSKLLSLLEAPQPDNVVIQTYIRAASHRFKGLSVACAGKDFDVLDAVTMFIQQRHFYELQTKEIAVEDQRLIKKAKIQAMLEDKEKSMKDRHKKGKDSEKRSKKNSKSKDPTEGEGKKKKLKRKKKIDMSKVECWNCKKTGHFKQDCPELSDNSSDSSSNSSASSCSSNSSQ